MESVLSLPWAPRPCALTLLFGATPWNGQGPRSKGSNLSRVHAAKALCEIVGVNQWLKPMEPPRPSVLPKTCTALQSGESQE